MSSWTSSKRLGGGGGPSPLALRAKLRRGASSTSDEAAVFRNTAGGKLSSHWQERQAIPLKADTNKAVVEQILASVLNGRLSPRLGLEE